MSQKADAFNGVARASETFDSERFTWILSKTFRRPYISCGVSYNGCVPNLFPPIITWAQVPTETHQVVRHSCPHNLLSEAMSKTGVCKFFNDEKGFGFIVQDDGSEDLFAHRNQISDGQNLVE